jgi:hypothetical protein
MLSLRRRRFHNNHNQIKFCTASLEVVVILISIIVTMQAKPSQFEDITPITKALDGDISIARFGTEIRSAKNIDQRL